MSSVAPRDAEIAYINGAGTFRPRLAERIARSRAITLDLARLEDETSVNETRLASDEARAPATLVVVPLPRDDAKTHDAVAIAVPAPLLVVGPADEFSAKAELADGHAKITEFPSDPAVSPQRSEIAQPSLADRAKPAADAPSPDVTTLDLAKLEEAALTHPSPSTDLDKAGAAPAEPITGSAHSQFQAFVEADGPVLSDARAIEAASQLVSLIAEQRTLLDAIQRAAETATARQLEPEGMSTTPGGPHLAGLAEPAPFVPAATAALLPHMTEPVAADDAEAERPPMIIERAQADHRAGIAWPEAERAETPQWLASFATGFGLAMAVGVVYWGFRSIV